MATVIINGNTYEWPDSGDKNWAANVTRVIQKVAVELDRNRTTAAKQGDNNVFTAPNRFTTVPTVGVSNDNANNVALATLDNITAASSSLSTEVTGELTTIRNFLATFLGVGISADSMVPYTRGLYDISGFSDFFKTLGGISNDENNASLLNVLNAIMGYLRALEPIGTIKSVYNDTSIPILRWEFINNSAENPPHDNAIWLHQFAGSPWTDGVEEGWYQPETDSGLWALCDGEHPLPIQPFGSDGGWDIPGYLSDGNRKANYTPNLLNAVLQGAAEGTMTTTGDNLHEITEKQLPAHSHDLSEYRVTGNIPGGGHDHILSFPAAHLRWGGTNPDYWQMYLPDSYGVDITAEQGSDDNGYTLRKIMTYKDNSTTHDGEGGHTHTLRANDNVNIEKTPPLGASEAVADRTGSGDSVDVGEALKRLPVKFYMKVAE